MIVSKSKTVDELFSNFTTGNITWDEHLGRYYIIKGNKCSILMHTNHEAAAEVVGIHLNYTDLNVFSQYFQWRRTKELKKKYQKIKLDFSFLDRKKEDITESRVVSTAPVKGGMGYLVDIGYTRFFIEVGVNISAIIPYEDLFRNAVRNISQENPFITSTIHTSDSSTVQEHIMSKIPAIIKQDPKDAFCIFGGWLKQMPDGFNPKDALSIPPRPLYPDHTDFNLTTECLNYSPYDRGPATVVGGIENETMKENQERYKDAITLWKDWTETNKQFCSMEHSDQLIPRQLTQGRGAGGYFKIASTNTIVAGVVRVGYIAPNAGNRWRNSPEKEMYIRGGLFDPDTNTRHPIARPPVLRLVFWHRYFHPNYVDTHEA